jgi:phosphoribosylpyrophosphate synthetase
LQEEFFFERNVVPRPLSAIPLLLEKLQDVPNLAIAFPDSGAEKRFGTMFAGYPLVVCHKVRDGDKRIITIKEGDPRGKNVVIVDDLVNTGGTLVSCKNALVHAGAQTVSAYVTHGLLPDESWKKFVDGGFRRFWITDSCPRTMRSVNGVKPFEILTLAESLAQIVTNR